MKHLLVLLMLLFAGNLSAQRKGQERIDSLTVELKKAKADTAKVNILNNLSIEYRINADYAVALDHSEKALALAKKIGFEKGIAYAYNSRANVFDTQGNYPEALKNHQASLKINEEMGDREGEAIAYRGIGAMYYEQGNYPEALKNYQTSLKINEEIKDKRGIASAHSSIGNVYYAQSNYPEALKSHLASLKIDEEINNKPGMSLAYSNIAGVYYAQTNYQEALKYMLKGLKIKEEMGDKQGLGQMYNNIGNIYDAQNNFPEALKNYLASLEIFKEIGYKKGMAFSFSNVGIFYRTQGDYPKSYEYLRDALKIAQEINDKRRIAAITMNTGKLYLYALSDKTGKAMPPEQSISMLAHAANISPPDRNGLLKATVDYLERAATNFKELETKDYYQSTQELLSEAYSMSGNYQKALEAYKEHTVYKDSIYNEDKTIELTQSAMNYEFEKTQDSIRLINEMEIAIRDASIASVRKQRWFLLGGLFALGLIGGLLYYQSRQRKKHNEKLHTLNTKLDQANRIKTRFFSILNHDLRSPVSNLIHFLHLKKENPELLDEETKNRLEQKTTQGAEDLLVTMEDLLLWSKGQMENFEPKPKHVSVDQLFADAKKVFSGYQQIRFEYQNPDDLDIVTDENYLKTIIRNLTSNAINVFTSTPDPAIVWKAFLQDDKFVLSITDNGPGADNEKFKALYDDKEVIGIKTGLGLHLIRDLAKAIDCEIEVDSVKGKGTIIVLRLSQPTV